MMYLQIRVSSGMYLCNFMYTTYHNTWSSLLNLAFVELLMSQILPGGDDSHGSVVAMMTGEGPRNERPTGGDSVVLVGMSSPQPWCCFHHFPSW